MSLSRSLFPFSRPCALTADRRTVLRAAAGLLLAQTLPLSAQARVAIATAINRTARYRALSQRAAKAYGLLYLQVSPLRSRDVLEAARKQIRAGLVDLDEQGWPPEVARLLGEVRKAAGQLDALLAQAPARDTYLAACRQSDVLLAAADKATQSLEQLAQAPSAKLVNVAGRQRMLSQRLARDYGLMAAGLAGSGARAQMAQDASEFQSALGQLGAAPISTPAIRSALELGQAQWLFFEAALKRQPDARGQEEVATTSERLLEVMDNLTGLYEAALRDVLG
ncbi:type IV pili methyl-accepting chemotaxis transducer N-terminal domain-containing protein [Pulveribacter suum]|uniref:NarX-like N-terminal domain-containing protein n=1 Tax=Pulveribacter suum TaxID=2116657 RepID=A0A2P1NLP0_9BURK|nr:type IV pili methyl-accepting chemotaxis transducer N-terminal domain-containing protein [Pulveribacter suum]AVP57917.1 hypothetical protein C7H73_09770 [Pulveribacter suum]